MFIYLIIDLFIFVLGVFHDVAFLSSLGITMHNNILPGLQMGELRSHPRLTSVPQLLHNGLVLAGAVEAMLLGDEAN